MISDIRELFRYRELLWSWTVRSIKVKYKQSLLGIVWAILQPLSATILFAVIFSYFVPVDTGGVPYPIFYYSALLPWTFFSISVSFAVPSLVNNMTLVTRIYFPREILPIAAVMASFVDFLVASVIFAGMLVLYQVPVGPVMLLFPILIVIQIALTLGVVLVASTVNVFYRDIRFVMPLGVQLWMYLTPIIYPVNLVPERWRALYMLNPMAGLINAYRSIILQGELPQLNTLGLAALVSGVICVAGYRYFKHMEWQFADII
jgi:lipopolysaccharide transport system permease protein